MLFTDTSHRLCCEIQFGEIKDSDDPLLRRSDTVQGVIFSLPADWQIGEQVPTVRHSYLDPKCFPCVGAKPSPHMSSTLHSASMTGLPARARSHIRDVFPEEVSLPPGKPVHREQNVTV